MPPYEKNQGRGKGYVQVILKESEVVLQPDLSPEKIEELATTPAYTRRHLKIDRP